RRSSPGRPERRASGAVRAMGASMAGAPARCATPGHCAGALPFRSIDRRTRVPQPGKLPRGVPSARSAGPRVEGVAQAVAEELEREEEQRQDAGGEGEAGPGDLDEVEMLADQHTEAGRRRIDTDADER